MDAAAKSPPERFHRLLPYWAVFQDDIRQIFRSWVYRTWVLVSVAAAAGYLLYHVGILREAGMIQVASKMISDLLRWTVYGSVTLVVVLTAGSISGEIGTLADSVLSRGISRYQYFLAKWHARLVVILGTFFVLGIAALLGSYFLLNDDLSLGGSLAALVIVATFLAAVITCGVTVSAISNSTVVGITVLWIILYGTAFVLSLLPPAFPSPDRAVNNLPYVLRGYYDARAVARLVAYTMAGSCLVAVVGLAYFARRDV
ncbi:MAG: ABC transporter permease [Gemmataceae bacterium]|nr:ABC transporter permease [Gemmataceae bacterium]MDW8265508.1 ABC transporter permease [Gemmataceae bacterium]